jgi:hypothetical protein
VINLQIVLITQMTTTQVIACKSKREFNQLFKMQKMISTIKPTEDLKNGIFDESLTHMEVEIP